MDNNADVIPREKFILLLTELHIADAILTQKSLYDRKLKDSTDSYYNFILVKHNISRKKFDKSLIHYASDLDDFTLIYDEVFENILFQTETFERRKSIFNLPIAALDLINEIPNDIKSTRGKNIWDKKRRWSLPEDGKNNTIKFEKTIFGQASFELSADILIYSDDETVKPTMLIYIFYKDGSNSTFKDTTIVKDAKWHTHKLKAKTVESKIPTKIVCKVLDHDAGTGKKRLKVRKISLIKTPIIIKPEAVKEPVPKKNKLRVIKN